MNSQNLYTHLTTICSERPGEIRSQVIAALRRAIPCESGTFVNCAEHDGQTYFCDLLSYGSDQELVDA